jgi:hypothetical protein
MMRGFVLILAALLTASLFAAGHDLTPPPAADQLWPVVTGNGSGFTAACNEATPRQSRVVSSVVNANGDAIEGGSAKIDQPPLSSIAIAHSPSESLLVWTTDDKVFAERLSPSGIPAALILVTFGNGYVSNVAAAWNGSRYFVTWSHGVQLVGAFVAADGSTTAPHIFFSEPVVSGQPQKELLVAPQVAWDGRHFIVLFGEVLNALCSFTCPMPPVDQFRVMRVSTDGDAVDSAPLVITGSHLRAQIASSGAGSLIVLDGREEITTIVAHDADDLTLEAEAPLFRWFSDVLSAVAWDGAAYTVGWQYTGANTSWIGAAHVTRSGLPFDYRVTALDADPSTRWGLPSMAANDAGATAFVISDAAGLLAFARARLYLTSELAPMPAPPRAPRNAVSSFAGNTARIDWQSGDDAAAGFLVEAWSPYFQTWYLVKRLPGDARSTTVYASIGDIVRVRAFGPGGVSEGTISSIGSASRRRAARP